MFTHGPYSSSMVWPFDGRTRSTRKGDCHTFGMLVRNPNDLKVGIIFFVLFLDYVKLYFARGKGSYLTHSNRNIPADIQIPKGFFWSKGYRKSIFVVPQNEVVELCASVLIELAGIRSEYYGLIG